MGFRRRTPRKRKNSSSFQNNINNGKTVKYSVSKNSDKFVTSGDIKKSSNEYFRSKTVGYNSKFNTSLGKKDRLSEEVKANVLNVESETKTLDLQASVMRVSTGKKRNFR